MEAIQEELQEARDAEGLAAQKVEEMELLLHQLQRVRADANEKPDEEERTRLQELENAKNRVGELQQELATLRSGMTLDAEVEQATRARDLEAAVERANREKHDARQARLVVEEQLLASVRKASELETERAKAYRLHEACEQERDKQRQEFEIASTLAAQNQASQLEVVRRDHAAMRAADEKAAGAKAELADLRRENTELRNLKDGLAATVDRLKGDRTRDLDAHYEERMKTLLEMAQNEVSSLYYDRSEKEVAYALGALDTSIGSAEHRFGDVLRALQEKSGPALQRLLASLDRKHELIQGAAPRAFGNRRVHPTDVDAYRKLGGEILSRAKFLHGKLLEKLRSTAKVNPRAFLRMTTEDVESLLKDAENKMQEQYRINAPDSECVRELDANELNGTRTFRMCEMNAANQKLDAARVVCFGSSRPHRLAQVKNSDSDANTRSDVAHDVIGEMANKLGLSGSLHREFEWFSVASPLSFRSAFIGDVLRVVFRMLDFVCERYGLPPHKCPPTAQSLSSAARIVPSVIEKVQKLLIDASDAFTAIGQPVPVVENDAWIDVIDQAVTACVNAMWTNGVHGNQVSGMANVDHAFLLVNNWKKMPRRT